MKPIILVKLGGSLLTDKTTPYRERPDIIARVSREIKEVREKSDFDLILGHGSGSYAHTPAVKYQTMRGVINKESLHGFCVVQDAASRLNRILVKSLIDAGVEAISLQPSASFIMTQGKISEAFLSPLVLALEKGILPVVYGDALFDRYQGHSIVSTEDILLYLSKALLSTGKFEVKQTFLFGDYEGVYDGNQTIIPEITQKSFPHFSSSLFSPGYADATGGMRKKVEVMLDLAEKGNTVHILSGVRPGSIREALLGTRISGTLIRRA